MTSQFIHCFTHPFTKRTKMHNKSVVSNSPDYQTTPSFSVPCASVPSVFGSSGSELSVYPYHAGLVDQKPDSHSASFYQPDALIQQFKPTGASYCLFLDIDGTLAEFCDNPQHSVIPQTTLATIQAIQQKRVPVIAVTGREIDMAQRLFKPLQLPIAGLHGLEIVLDQTTCLSPDLSHIDYVQLRQQIEHACSEYPRLLLEDKQHSFALHYRQCPELEPVAHDILKQLQKSYPQMKLNDGKCVVEILPEQADKGRAIQTILAHLTVNQVIPIFIGDDITDESGFRTVNTLQGISIKVGAGATDAQYRLADIAAVAEFLHQFHQFLHCGAANHEVTDRTPTQDGEHACPS